MMIGKKTAYQTSMVNNFPDHGLRPNEINLNIKALAEIALGIILNVYSTLTYSMNLDRKKFSEKIISVLPRIGLSHIYLFSPDKEWLYY